MIDSYEFGAIVINGKRYSSDVIIYPGRYKMIGGEKRGTNYALTIWRM